MKPIFSRGPSLQFRLILAVLVALGVIIADSRLGTFSQIRTYMDTAVSPFYFISNGPRELLDSVSQTLSSRDQLELENRALRQELLLKNSELLMLGQYKQENARLRELLGSPLRQDEQKMVTQVRMAEHTNRGICAGLFTVANRRRGGETSARSWPLRRMGFSDYSGVDAGGGELVNAALNPPMGGRQAAADGDLCDDGCRTGRVYRHPEREQIRKRYP